MPTRLEDSAQLFGVSSGVLTHMRITCDMCHRTYPACTSLSEPGWRFLSFGGLTIVSCCFHKIEEAVIQRMMHILPWYVQLLSNIAERSPGKEVEFVKYIRKIAATTSKILTRDAYLVHPVSMLQESIVEEGKKECEIGSVHEQSVEKPDSHEREYIRRQALWRCMDAIEHASLITDDEWAMIHTLSKENAIGVTARLLLLRASRMTLTLRKLPGLR